jgi:outer membrane lipoprotein-sorting protein
MPKPNKHMKQKLLLAAFLLLMIVNVQAQSVDDILSKYFTTIGGVDKWKALQSMKTSGNMTMQGFDLPFTLYAKRPNMMYMQIQVQGMDIIQAYDGKDAWMVNPFAGGKDPVKMTPEESKEMTERNFEDEFIDYKSKGHEITFQGTEEVDGVKCFKLQLVKNKNNDKEDVTEIHYFDSENYVPIMVIGYARSGPMKGTETRSYLSDYQEVNGLMLPFSTEVKVAGQTVQKMTFQKVNLNESVDDKMFAYPAK